MTVNRNPNQLILCDFDDTIVLDNLSRALLTAFAPPDWRAIEDSYQRGEITVEKSNQLQWANMTTGRKELQEYIRSRAVVREGFLEFAGYCRGYDIRLAVLSNGLDLYILPVLAQMDLEDMELYCGSTEFREKGVGIRYLGPSGTEIADGFKMAWIEHFLSLGFQVTYIGDGQSDIGPAMRADRVFARSTLAEHLQSTQHPYSHFETFYDVIDAIKEGLRVEAS